MQKLGHGRRKLNRFGVDKFLHLFEQRRKERVKHWDGKEVLVEKGLMPMSAVLRVGELGVNSHDRRE